MDKRDKTIIKKVGLVILATLVCATVPMAQEAPAASKVTFGGNLFVDPCFDL